ncbi:MAG: RluA family pseudouridine synthase [Prevotellaceae bacterium]|nr:RluA family pseudouridine synthase [Prevotellaceae bacterium]
MENKRKTYYYHKVANKYTDYVVKDADELMAFLMKVVPGANRTKIKGFLTQKMVFVDHRIETQYNAPLVKGQLVQISNRGNKHAFHNKFVKIIYEDAFILVVEKERGILTNAQPGTNQITVKTILDEYVRRQNRTMSVHTVHRLDRETSGLLLFAKRRDVQQMFVEHWRETVTDRRYIAVVQGEMEKDYGTVASWLKDNKMFVVYSSVRDNGGQYAVTHYQTLKRANGLSLVELKLETGRKNQIRVHMQDLHHPIVGDMKYGCDIDPIGRICLHAFKLEFVHPITKELLKFETPYPAAFCKLLSGKKD